MRQTHAFHVAIAAVLSGCAPALQAQAASSCRPADQSSDQVQAMVSDIATGTDSLSKADRDSTGIPATTISKISLTTDSRTCDKAVQAVNTVFGTPGVARQVYVIKIDASFAVVDPQSPPGMDAVFIFDRKWIHKETMLP